MKKRQKRIGILVISILLMIGIFCAALLVYKKSKEPVLGTDCNLHEAAVLARAADFLHSESAKKTLTEKIKAIERLDIDSLDFNEFVLYITIFQKLSLELDGEIIRKTAEKFYNPSEMLFSVSFVPLEEEEGFLPVDLSSTMSLVKVYPNALEWEEYSLREGIINAIKNMEYCLPNEGKTFYNSGGIALAAIYTLKTMNIVDDIAFLPEEIAEWYQAWKSYFQEKKFSVLSFAGFYPVAMVMEGECSVAELQNYYELLTPEIIMQDSNNILMILQFLPLVDTEKNPAYFEAFKAAITEMVENHQFVKTQ